MSTRKPKAIKVPLTYDQTLRALSEATGQSLAQVTAVLQALAELTERHLVKGACGAFKPPYLGIKVERQTRPARKARMGRNPATGEPLTIAAKPKQAVVRIKALKALKDSVT